MYRKSCRLTIADRAYFGGTTPDIPQRDFSAEWPDIKTGIKGNINQYEQFAQNKDPILKMLYGGAQDLFQQGPSPLLKQLTDLVSNPDYLSGRVGAQEMRDVVDQPTLAKFASMGNIGGNQAAISNFLNREQFTQARQAQHLGQAADVEQLGLKSIAQRFALPESVFQTASSGYANLTNPIWKYMEDLFSSNQNAAAAESVAGANAASGNKSGIMSTIGTVVGGVATAY